MAAYTVSAIETKKFSPLRNMYKKRLVERLQDEGVSVEDAEWAIAQLEGDRPLLDWLTNGGLMALVKMIMEMLLLFKGASTQVQE